MVFFACFPQNTNLNFTNKDFNFQTQHKQIKSTDKNCVKMVHKQSYMITFTSFSRNFIQVLR